MGRHSEKDTVEDYYSVSTKFLNEHGYFKTGFQAGTVTWRRGLSENVARVGISVSTWDNEGELNFQYTTTDRMSGAKTEFDYKVRLVSTSCYYGGKRWWFICPLITHNVACCKRVGVLYLGSKYFGCRQCYDLVYQSSKDSHKFDRLFNKLGITDKMARKMLERGEAGWL